MQLTIGSRAMNLSPEVRKQIAAKVREHRALEREYPRRDTAREMLDLWLHMATALDAAPAINLYDNDLDRARADDRVCEREIHTSRALSDMARYRHGGL